MMLDYRHFQGFTAGIVFVLLVNIFWKTAFSYMSKLDRIERTQSDIMEKLNERGAE